MLGGLLVTAALLCGGVSAFLLPTTPPSSLLQTKQQLAPAASRAATPAIGHGISSTHTISHPLGGRRGHSSPLLLRAQYDDDGDEFEGDATASFFDQRGAFRPLFTAAVWLGFVLYAVDLAPGMEEAARAADQKLLTDLIADPLAASVTPLFAMVCRCMCACVCVLLM